MKFFDLNILPVAKGQFSSTKPDLAEVMVKQREGRVMLADRHNPDGTTTEVFILARARDCAMRISARKTMITVGNAKNKRPYGEHFVKGVFDFAVKGGVLQVADVPCATMVYSDLMSQEAVVFQQA